MVCKNVRNYLRLVPVGLLISCGGQVAIDDESVQSTAITILVVPDLDFNLPAVATSPAERITTTTQITVPQTTTPVGLFGLPFAPEGLENCEEMSFYRIQWGLPERFQSLGWRESNCRNEESVRTYCCYGYWQMYFTQHYRDHNGTEIYKNCEVDEISDYNGDEPLDKQKQACTVKGLYDLLGYTPWNI
jgi:hypothetical protein